MLLIKIFITNNHRSTVCWLDDLYQATKLKNLVLVLITQKMFRLRRKKFQTIRWEYVIRNISRLLYKHPAFLFTSILAINISVKVRLPPHFGANLIPLYFFLSQKITCVGGSLDTSLEWWDWEDYGKNNDFWWFWDFEVFVYRTSSTVQSLSFS